MGIQWNQRSFYDTTWVCKIYRYELLGEVRVGFISTRWIFMIPEWFPFNALLSSMLLLFGQLQINNSLEVIRKNCFKWKSCYFWGLSNQYWKHEPHSYSLFYCSVYKESRTWELGYYFMTLESSSETKTNKIIIVYVS